MVSPVDPPLLVIAGPTASGKSHLALHIAEHFNGEIVSCDSVAVYRGMDVGTAKPSAAERARVPHHLLDVVDPDQSYTAGDFSREARLAIHSIALGQRLPIVVGGTGLYLRALLDGLFTSPPSDPALRARLRARESSHLHRLLSRLDPAAARAVHPNDKPKLVRTLEVSLTARRPMSALWDEGRDPMTGFRILRLGLRPTRPALYARIDERAASMFSSGLVEETRGLSSQIWRGTPSHKPGVRAGL